MCGAKIVYHTSLVHEFLKFLQHYIAGEFSGVSPYRNAVAIDYKCRSCFDTGLGGCLFVFVDIELVYPGIVAYQFAKPGYYRHHVHAV